MSYYILTVPLLSDVGGRGEGQIKTCSTYPWSNVNDKLRKYDAQEIKDLSRVEFEMRYDARITDIISAVMFHFSLWFVSLNFLRCIEKLKMYPYRLEPAKLKYRNKYLEDYFLFQPALVDYGLDLIDFPGSHFEIQYSYPNRIEPVDKISNKKEYLQLSEKLRAGFASLKLLSLKFAPSCNYDFFYIAHLPVGHVGTERFVYSFKENGIKGVWVLELSIDPYAQIWPKPSEIDS